MPFSRMSFSLAGRFAVAAMLVASVIDNAFAAESPEIRIAPLPPEGRMVIHEQFQGLSDYLGRAVKRRFRWVYLSDYVDIIEQFSSNQDRSGGANHRRQPSLRQH